MNVKKDVKKWPIESEKRSIHEFFTAVWDFRLRNLVGKVVFVRRSSN